MQLVSQKWIDNENSTIRNNAFVKILFSLIDVTAKLDATIADNGHLYYSSPAEINAVENVTPQQIATFEQDFWATDGSFVLPPVSGVLSDICYISNVLSDSNGDFTTTQPQLIATFDNYHNSAGVSIIFDYANVEYAVDYSIVAYKDNVEVAHLDVVGNSLIETINKVNMVGYNKVIITFKKWSSPNQRARVTRLSWGLEYTWTNEEIISHTKNEYASVVSSELSKSTINFSINNIDKSFNPQNPFGVASYLVDQQPIKCYYGYDIDGIVEWIDGGTYFLTDWKTPENSIEASFEGNSVIALLTDSYYKGVYSESGISLYDMAVDVVNDIRPELLALISYDIDDSLKSIIVKTSLPVMTHSQCLQLIANAGGCILGVDRQGKIFIRPASKKQYGRSVLLNNCFSQPEISLTKPVKNVNTKIYSYAKTLNSEGLEQENEVYKDTLIIEEPTIIYPTFSSKVYQVTSVEVQNGSYDAGQSHFYTNGAEMLVNGTGEITVIIKGKILTESIKSTLYSVGDLGSVETIDNKLITEIQQAKNVSYWAGTEFQNRVNYKAEYRGHVEFDVFDGVFIETRYSTTEVEGLNITSANEEYYSNVAEVVSVPAVTPLQIATFEQDYWETSGTFILTPTEPPYTNVGYVSRSLCDENGIFDSSDYPTLELITAKSSTTNGFTITFDEHLKEYATKIKISAYSDKTKLVETIIENNTGPVFEASLSISAFNKIIISVLEWNKPIRRARISNFSIMNSAFSFLITSHSLTFNGGWKGTISGVQKTIGGVAPYNVSGLSVTAGIKSLNIKWNDPNDTVVSDVVVSSWAGTKLVRKIGSYPIDETDGILVIDNKNRNIYSSSGYTDTGLTTGTEYFYQLFPYNKTGDVNRNIENRIYETPN